MQLLDLPNELLLAVAEQLETVSEINSLVQACRRLHNLLHLYLYHEDLRQGNHRLRFTRQFHNRASVLELRRLMEKGAGLGPEFALYLRVDFKVIGHALYFASRWGHPRVAAFLLKNGATWEDPGRYRLTAFCTAIKFGHEALVRLFLENGARANDTVGQSNYEDGEYVGDYTPLHLASMRGDPKIVSLLLEHGASIGAKGASGRTPLQWAVLPSKPYFRKRPLQAAGWVETVKLLLQHGAEPRMQDGYGECPNDYVGSYPEIDYLRFLKINTLGTADAEALESDVRTRLQAPGCWTWDEREGDWYRRYNDLDYEERRPCRLPPQVFKASRSRGQVVQSARPHQTVGQSMIVDQLSLKMPRPLKLVLRSPCVEQCMCRVVLSSVFLWLTMIRVIVVASDKLLTGDRR